MGVTSDDNKMTPSVNNSVSRVSTTLPFDTTAIGKENWSSEVTFNLTMQAFASSFPGFNLLQSKVLEVWESKDARFQVCVSIIWLDLMLNTYMNCSVSPVW